MKNACIVRYNENSALSTANYTPVVDAFRALGYPFEQIRILFGGDNTLFCQTLTELKKDNDNILVLTDKASLAYTKSVIVASGVFADTHFQANAGGGGIFSEKEKTLFLLSLDASDTGKAFADSVCAQFLRQKYGNRFEKMTIRTVGANATHVQRLITQAKSIDGGNMRYQHSYAYGEDVIEIFYGQTAPKMLVDDVLRLFAEGLGETVYALDDTPLQEQLVNLLKLRGKKLSVAESFTGGGIARKITSVSGASEVYFEGLNTYNELSKIKRLGVSAYTLKTLGAVSDRTAYEMASGLISSGDCDISIATTGLAGPNTDRSMLPVGLCYIAVGSQERVFVYRYKFNGSREEITQTAINYALFLAYKQLKNM